MSENKSLSHQERLRDAADAYVAERGIDCSGGIVERAFEAGALWSVENTNAPYGYVFGGCTFLRNGSPLLTEYVTAESMAVFLHPSENVMETYKEVMTKKIEAQALKNDANDVETFAELLCETFASADPGDDGMGKAWPYAREWEKASWRKVAQTAITHAPSPQTRETVE